jgi:hypothetical protein
MDSGNDGEVVSDILIEVSRLLSNEDRYLGQYNIHGIDGIAGSEFVGRLCVLIP